MGPGRPIVVPAPIVAPVVPEHELLRPIASGAYGQVWLARNRLGVYRAVKVVHRASFDHDRPFEREFAGINAFEPISRSHEGFVDLLQVGRDDAAGYFYYVMELADDLNADRTGTGNPKLEIRNPNPIRAGGNGKDAAAALQPSSIPLLQDPTAYVPRTLASDFKRRGRLPLDECTFIGLALTDALAYLHRQGLVHRDVKPSNIIFVRGVPKLADVGLVTGMGEARSFVGTEGFIAPEGPGTPQADLYSLGIVLYVISTGKNHQDFPEPPTDPPVQASHSQVLEFDAVVHKACRAEPRERFSDASAMHEELALLQRGESVRQKRAARWRWALARRFSLAVIPVALALAILPFLRISRREHKPVAEAVREYELGRWFYNKLTPESRTNAIAHLNRAIQLDPKYVEPYGQLTAWYVWDVGTPERWEEQRLRTREIAEKVFAINPNLAEGHTSLSWSKFLERDWEGAEQEIVRAIKLNPRYPIARDIYCFYLSMLGRTEEAHHQIQKSLELDPTARTTGMVASWPFVAERKFDQAIAQLKRVIELEQDFPQAHTWLAKCYLLQRNYPAAINEFKTADLLNGEDPPRIAAIYWALRQAYDASGEHGYFQKCIELVDAEHAVPEEHRVFDETDLAGCYAMLGDKRRALDELEKHFEEMHYWELNFEPFYDTLHDEPRFKALLRRAGLVK